MALSDEQKEEIELLKCMYVEEYTEIDEKTFSITLQLDSGSKGNKRSFMSSCNGIFIEFELSCREAFSECLL